MMTSYLRELPGQRLDHAIDMRIIPDKADSSLYRLHTLYRDGQSDKQFRHVAIALRQNTGKAAKAGMITHLLSIPGTDEILDVRLADDQTILALAGTETATNIHSCNMGVAANEDWERQHFFKNGQMAAGMRPGSLDINGHVGRRAVAVLDKSGLGYTVFDLDADPELQAEDMDSSMTG
jgi:hypothetical protein